MSRLAQKRLLCSLALRQFASGAMWNSKHSTAYITPTNATIPSKTFFISLSAPCLSCSDPGHCRTRVRMCKRMPIHHCKMSIELCIILRFQFHVAVEGLIDVRHIQIHIFERLSPTADILIHFIGIAERSNAVPMQPLDPTDCFWPVEKQTFDCHQVKLFRLPNPQINRRVEVRPSTKRKLVKCTNISTKTNYYFGAVALNASAIILFSLASQFMKLDHVLRCISSIPFGIIIGV